MTKNKTPFIFLFLLLSALSSAAAAVEPAKTQEVYRVIDGDTLVLRNEERVKLIGIDAPEAINGLKLHRDARKLGVKSQVVKGMGLQAKAFTANLVGSRKVRLEFEGPKRDRNGRIRAYAYLEDGTSVNAEILRQGYATVLEQPGLKHAGLFREMQQEAMQHERGLWKFIQDREIQLLADEYKNLTEDQRREVLQYIRNLKSAALPIAS
jgi:micrococcal nuclease